MRIATDEPSLTALFQKGQVGLIRLEFQRLLDVIADLQAEHDRLRASSFVTAVPVEQYERVVKAGDVIARIIAPPAHGPGEYDGEWYAWHNAKDGVLPRQSPPDTPSTAV